MDKNFEKLVRLRDNNEICLESIYDSVKDSFINKNTNKILYNPSRLDSFVFKFYKESMAQFGEAITRHNGGYLDFLHSYERAIDPRDKHHEKLQEFLGPVGTRDIEYGLNPGNALVCIEYSRKNYNSITAFLANNTNTLSFVELENFFTTSKRFKTFRLKYLDRLGVPRYAIVALVSCSKLYSLYPERNQFRSKKLGGHLWHYCYFDYYF